jgi:hypothetical protein
MTTPPTHHSNPETKEIRILNLKHREGTGTKAEQDALNRSDLQAEQKNTNRTNISFVILPPISQIATTSTLKTERPMNITQDTSDQDNAKPAIHKT